MESVNQILALQPHARIILCAPSNPATDTLATRLASSGVVKPHEMLRLNDENRTFAEVPDAIRGYCCMHHLFIRSSSVTKGLIQTLSMTSLGSHHGRNSCGIES